MFTKGERAVRGWINREAGINIYTLLLLSRFSRVQLCAIPETAAYQAPPSLGEFCPYHTIIFFLLYKHSYSWNHRTFILLYKASVIQHDVLRTDSFQFSSVAQSCPTLCSPMDCSMPGFPIHHQLPEPTQTHVRCVGDAI